MPLVRNRLLSLLMLSLFVLSACSVLPSTEPVYYDDLPESDGEGAYRALSYWPNSEVTYQFLTGTAQVEGDREFVLVRQAFALWQASAGIQFSEAVPGQKADILIGWYAGAHGDPDPFDGPGGVLAHASFPNPYRAVQVRLHFDDQEFWVDSTSRDVDLLTVAAHEIGHALGLGHSRDPAALMYPQYLGPHRRLGQGDVAGVQALYGSPAVLVEQPNQPAAIEPRLEDFLTALILAEIKAFETRDSTLIAGYVSATLLRTIQMQIDDLDRRGLVQVAQIDFANSYIADIRQIGPKSWAVDTCEYWTTRHFRRQDGSLLNFSGPRLVPQTLVVRQLDTGWRVEQVKFQPAPAFCSRT